MTKFVRIISTTNAPSNVSPKYIATYSADLPKLAKSFNTQYMTNSTLVSPVKIEYGWNFSISGQKMMMKSGLGKTFLKFLHALTMLFLLLNLYFLAKFSNKNDMESSWRNFKNIFPRTLFIIIFKPEMLKSHPYSILTGDTRVEFVIYCLLRYYWKKSLWGVLSPCVQWLRVTNALLRKPLECNTISQAGTFFYFLTS